MKAKFVYEFIDDVLTIIDHKGARSVTNDIENILRVIHMNEAIDLSKRKIIYRDTFSIWDAVFCINNGTYSRPNYSVNFILLREQNIERAIIAINKHHHANEKIN